MNDVRLAYAAGFVDGEGCVVISQNGSISLTIINTSLVVLNTIQDTLGCGKVTPRKQQVNKPQYQYRAYGDDCAEVLERLLPYLIEKKEQAELALDYRKNCRPVRIPGRRGVFRNPSKGEYIERMKELKRE